MAVTAVTHDEAALVAALAKRDIRHLRLATKTDSSPQLTTTALIEAFQRKFAHFKAQLSKD